MPMADKGNDPLALWQRMFADMQKGFNALAGQAIASSSRLGQPAAPAGSEGSGPPRQLEEFMERYLVSVNMPSRAQMAGLADRLLAIEGQLNDIKALLLEMQAGAAGTPPPPKPPRARRQPRPLEPKPSAEEGT
jgi:hypothetical protein